MAIAPDVVEMTPERLLEMNREIRYELIDGQLVEKPHRGAEANLITTNLIILMGTHIKAHELGICFGPECGYQIFAKPKHVRYPDGSFVRTGRLPGDKVPRGHMRIAPDLVIEVVSPNDGAENLDNRITDYLGAGVPRIWGIFPESRHVQVYRRGGSSTRLGPDDELSGEEVLPGFACRVSEVFAGT